MLAVISSAYTGSGRAAEQKKKLLGDADATFLHFGRPTLKQKVEKSGVDFHVIHQSSSHVPEPEPKSDQTTNFEKCMATVNDFWRHFASHMSTSAYNISARNARSTVNGFIQRVNRIALAAGTTEDDRYLCRADTWEQKLEESQQRFSKSDLQTLWDDGLAEDLANFFELNGDDWDVGRFELTLLFEFTGQEHDTASFANMTGKQQAHFHRDDILMWLKLVWHAGYDPIEFVKLELAMHFFGSDWRDYLNILEGAASSLNVTNCCVEAQKSTWKNALDLICDQKRRPKFDIELPPELLGIVFDFAGAGSAVGFVMGGGRFDLVKKWLEGKLSVAPFEISREHLCTNSLLMKGTMEIVLSDESSMKVWNPMHPLVWKCGEMIDCLGSPARNAKYLDEIFYRFGRRQYSDDALEFLTKYSDDMFYDPHQMIEDYRQMIKVLPLRVKAVVSTLLFESYGMPSGWPGNRQVTNQTFEFYRLVVAFGCETQLVQFLQKVQRSIRLVGEDGCDAHVDVGTVRLQIRHAEKWFEEDSNGIASTFCDDLRETGFWAPPFLPPEF